MTKITVTDLNGLATYGQQVKTVASAYEAEVSSANQQLSTKSAGEKGEAVNAFLAKLNILQTQVFTNYPQELKNLGTTVSNYEATLSGLGFQRKAWTDDGGAQTVASKLRGEQTDKIEEKRGNLQKALDHATGLLGTDRVSVGSAASSAAQSLNDAGNQRKQVDDSMQAAYSTFTSQLENSKAALTGLTSAMNNARCIGSLDVGTVLANIAAGRMTAAHMNDIDAIQDTGDGAVLNAIYSPDKFKKLGQVNPERMSEQMSSLVYREMFKEVDSLNNPDNPDLKNIETFLQTLSEQDVKKVQTYMEKLTKAGDRLGLVMLGEGMDKMPGFPKNATTEQLAKYSEELAKISPELKALNQRLKRAAALTGLFEGVYAWEMGKTVEIRDLGETQYLTHNTLQPGSLKFNGERITFEHEFYKNGQLIASNTTEVLHYLSSKGIDADKIVNNLENLQEKRNQAAVEFVKELGQGVTSFVPGGTLANTAVNVVASLSESLTSGKVKNSDLGTYAGSVSSLTPEKLRSQYKFGADTIKWLGNYVDKMQDINKEIEANKEALTSNLFDIGGLNVNYGDKGKNIVNRYAPEYDLQAALEMRDLEQNGLRGYMYRTGVEQAQAAGLKGQQAIDAGQYRLDGFETAIENSQPSRSYTNKVKNFLAGEGSRDVSLDIERSGEGTATNKKKLTMSELWKGIKDATGDTNPDDEGNVNAELHKYTGTSPDTALDGFAKHYSRLVGD